MIWILATRGAATRLRNSPFTETPIEGVHSAIYRPGVEPIAASGRDAVAGELGTFTRGLHRASGLLFSYDGSAAEKLLGITAAVDLILRYRAHGQQRKRTLLDVIFVGDAAVTLPGQNSGIGELIGVPFRVQIPAGEALGDHIVDEVD